MDGFDRSTWETPPEVVRALHRTWRGVDLDPATTAANPVRARAVFAPGTRPGDVVPHDGLSYGPDALAASWPVLAFQGGRWPSLSATARPKVWINPPWRGSAMPILPWAERARAFAERHAATVAFLAPANLSAPWFHCLLGTVSFSTWYARPRVLAFERRLAFVRPDTGEVGARPNVSTMLVALGWLESECGMFVDALEAEGVGARWL